MRTMDRYASTTVIDFEMPLSKKELRLLTEGILFIINTFSLYRGPGAEFNNVIMTIKETYPALTNQFLGRFLRQMIQAGMFWVQKIQRDGQPRSLEAHLRYDIVNPFKRSDGK